MASCKETTKRLKILKKLIPKLEEYSKGIILTGSLAYAPGVHIKKSSDIDLILITDDLKNTGANFIDNQDHKLALDRRFFDGYCLKKIMQKIPISYHILSLDAFDIISKCFIADIRVFRQKPKEGKYTLRNFNGKEYPYKIKNKILPEFNGEGFRTIVPVSFTKYDTYYNGIYRDKLLCNPKILFDPNKTLEKGIEKLWEIVVMNLRHESLRVKSGINLPKKNILNSLAKADKLSDLSKSQIQAKTREILGTLNQQDL